MARRRKTETTVNLTEAEKRQKIAAAFPELWELMCKVKDARNQHIKPLTDGITKLKRRLKADTGTDWADCDPEFRRFCREQIADAAEDEADAERIRANARRVFLALKEGEVLDIFTMLTLIDGAEPEQEDDMFEREEPAAAEERQAEVAGEIEEVEEEPEPEVATVDQVLAAGGNAQGEGDSEDDTLMVDALDPMATVDDEEFVGAGKPFNEGRKAGADGLLAEANPYQPASVKGKMWEKGRKVGAANAGNVVPLPTGTAATATSVH